MRSFAILALACLILASCERPATAPRAVQPSSEPVEPTLTPSTPTFRLDESLVKRKADKIVSVDLKSLSGTELEAAIQAVTELDSIEEVSLSGDDVTDERIEPIVGIVTLKRLRLPQSKVSDVSLARLATVGNLELLDLTDVESLSKNGAASIGKLTKLKELSLMNTPATDDWLASLATLTQLKKLRLRGTEITGDDFGAMATMPIIDLDLSETRFGNQGMSVVAMMPKLERLNLWLTQIDDSGLAELEGKTSLKLLNLDNVAAVTDASVPVIEKLVNLELLHLGGTQITESSIPKLASLKKLETLFLTRLNIGKEAAESLKQQMPQLDRFEY